jgi:hypothetical protein
VDASGNVYVADYFNNKIRKITPASVVSTLAGSESQGSADGTGSVASFNDPSGEAVDASGNVYVADYFNNKIRKITPAGVVSTFAGTGVSGNTNGIGSLATFNTPSGVALDAYGNIYVAAYNRIRKITSVGVVSSLVTAPIGSTIGSIGPAFSVAVDASGNV